MILISQLRLDEKFLVFYARPFAYCVISLREGFSIDSTLDEWSAVGSLMRDDV